MSQSQFTLGGGSESGGNESDNSADEPVSTASDTNLLKKNTAQIKPALPNKMDTALLNRSGIAARSGYQPLIREDSVRSHRNSIHGYILSLIKSVVYSDKIDSNALYKYF